MLTFFRGMVCFSKIFCSYCLIAVTSCLLTFLLPRFSNEFSHSDLVSTAYVDGLSFCSKIWRFDNVSSYKDINCTLSGFVIEGKLELITVVWGEVILDLELSSLHSTLTERWIRFSATFL